MEVLSFPAFSKQLRTEGSIFEPPKAATSPSCRGTWMQSCKSSPNLRWSTKRLGSAISRNKSRNHAISNYNWNAIYVIRVYKQEIPFVKWYTLQVYYTHIYTFLPDVLCRVTLVQLWKTKLEFVLCVDWKEIRWKIQKIMKSYGNLITKKCYLFYAVMMTMQRKQMDHLS